MINFLKKSKNEKLKIINIIQAILFILLMIMFVYTFCYLFTLGSSSTLEDIISNTLVILLIVTEAYRFVLIEPGYKIIVILNIAIFGYLLFTDIESGVVASVIIIYLVISTLLTHRIDSSEDKKEKTKKKKKK